MLLLLPLTLKAEEGDIGLKDSLETLRSLESLETLDSLDSLKSLKTDSLKPKPKKFLLTKLSNALEAVLGYINDVDTAYIRPQEYNWAVMLQSTTNLESYKLETKSGQIITFEPEQVTKIGPYAGWRWAFFGYTFDVKTLRLSDRIDLNLSLYSSIFNLDFIWRDSGKNYRIRRAALKNPEAEETFSDIPFNGMDTYIRGMNFYYVLNHKRFSYPAAFAQSTMQRRSAGSAIVGIGYTHHRLNMDYGKLVQTLDGEIDKCYPGQNLSVGADSTLKFNTIEHKSLSASGGYAYNQVLSKNFLLAVSLTAGIAIKKSIGDIQNDRFTYRDFKIENVNFDGCGRFGLVYNNMKWFAGTNAVLHYYSYNKAQFHTANWFATLNLYAGFNFGKRKR